ncbi:MAG TPA: CAP domain-containing protein [Patescibacteria group bacterium]|nr:CAP domain-containing protein [Patescibacteria group bacterium]
MARRNRKPTQKNKFFKRFIILAVFCFVVTALGSRLFFPPPVSLHVLGKLSVPKAPVVYFPPTPFIAEHIESPVLGAETIDPTDIITYVNNERMKRGSPPLRENTVLTKAAQMRVNVIFKYNNFAHRDPYEHIQLDTVLPMLHYPFTYASENIGMGESSAAAFVNGFMSSTYHRVNLLNPDLQETGVALGTDRFNGYYVTVVVQIFAIPATPAQYLGYKQEDVQQYKALLTDVHNQIALTKERLTNHVGDAQYNEGWQKILIRQQEILTTLYDTMLAQQPFVSNLIALITEYNNNWSLVPKT